jgi:hypothetical protein
MAEERQPGRAAFACDLGTLSVLEQTRHRELLDLLGRQRRATRELGSAGACVPAHALLQGIGITRSGLLTG